MDVRVWLRSLGLGQYEATFRDNEIDGAVLPRLTVDDLKDLGVADCRRSPQTASRGRGIGRPVASAEPRSPPSGAQRRKPLRSQPSAGNGNGS